MSSPIVPLSELCELDRQGLHPDDPNALRLPFVGVEHVESESGALNFNNGSRIGSQKSTTFRFDERHVLYAKLRPYLNKVATPGFTGRCSTELVPLLPRDGVDREFIAYLLRRKETVKFVMSSVTGARMPRTDMKALMSLPVPLPPLAEQRRIVGILNRAAKINRLRVRAQERLREFMPALFIEMFGDPVKNPMGWEVRALSEVCQINPPARKFECSSDMAVSFVPMSAVDGRFGTITSPEKRQLAEVAKGYTSFEEGDVLFAKITPCMENGKAALARNLINGIGRGSTEFFVLRVSEGIMEDYLFQYIRRQEFRNEAKRNFTGTAGQQRVPKSFLQNVRVPIPPIDEQRRFVNRVGTIGTMTELSKSNMEHTKLLFGSLMGRLLENTQ